MWGQIVAEEKEVEEKEDISELVCSMEPHQSIYIHHLFPASCNYTTLFSTSNRQVSSREQFHIVSQFSSLSVRK